MMRVSREEESYFGRARTNMTGRAKIGFAKDGRITALDLFIVQDNGPYGPMGDHRSAGLAASLVYQAPAMRWRAVNVLTNTPPRTQQRSPGPMQANGKFQKARAERRECVCKRQKAERDERQCVCKRQKAERDERECVDQVRETVSRRRSARRFAVFRVTVIA